MGGMCVALAVSVRGIHSHITYEIKQENVMVNLF